jgi:hypothetical protein
MSFADPRIWHWQKWYLCGSPLHDTPKPHHNQMFRSNSTLLAKWGTSRHYTYPLCSAVFFQDFCSRSYNLYKSLDFDICGSLSKNAITSFTIIDRCGLPACCVPGCRRLLVLCIPSPGPETCNKASFKQIIYNQYASYELDHQLHYTAVSPIQNKLHACMARA